MTILKLIQHYVSTIHHERTSAPWLCSWPLVDLSYCSPTLGKTNQRKNKRVTRSIVFNHYRASKVAANILIQNWNIELARLWLEEKNGDYQSRPCVFPISPGVVKTDMAGPNSNALLTVEESVNGMTAVISAVRNHKQSSFYLYNGEILEHYPEPLMVTVAKKSACLN